MTRTRERLSALDGLRGLAAMGVAFLWHFQHFDLVGPLFTKSLPWFGEFGLYLVNLFFVLSGFIFAHVYQKPIENRQISFLKFLFWRLSRLYPLHLITFIVAAAGQFTYHHLTSSFFIYGANKWTDFILNLFLVQFGWIKYGQSFNGPAWSISLEMFAYTVFFILVFFSTRKNRLLFYLALIITGFTFKYHHQIFIFNIYIGQVLIGFFTGCLAYEANKHFKRLLTGNQKIIFGLLLLGISSLLPLKENPLLYSLLVFPIIILICLNSQLLNSLLSLAPFSFLGKISYSIYLWHFPVQLTIVSVAKYLSLTLSPNTPGFFLFYVSTVLAIATLSYHYFELPIQSKARDFWNKHFP